MDKKIKAIKISTVIVSVIMFVCIIILAFQFIKIANLKEKTKSLETYKENLIKDITTYDSANAYYNNNREEFLEDYAREVLGWGNGDDTWYSSQPSK